MRAFSIILTLGFLSACAATVPDSGAGVGFDNSKEAQRARDAALTGGQPLVPPSVISDESTAAPSAPLAPPLRASARPVLAPAAIPTVVASPESSAPGSSEDIAAQTAAALAATSPTAASNPGISDENDFAAVSARETPESDARRVAGYREQYKVIEPEPLPSRSSAGSQPNIVEYALSTRNPRGNRIYARSSFNNAAKAARNCAKYASADLAQIDFLSGGGPEKDRKGLDPDGDGYACGWDPAPFRQAINN